MAETGATISNLLKFKDFSEVTDTQQLLQDPASQ